MYLKRFASHVAVASLTFIASVALTSLLLSQRRVEEAQQSTISVGSANSIQGQASKSEKLLKEIRFPRVWDEVATAGGKLEIVESDFLTWRVSLNGRDLLSSDEHGSLPPLVIKHRVTPFDEVAVIGHADGNCCELHRFWFLGLRSDGSYFLSKAIGDGFVNAPEVIVEGDSLRVRIRSGLDPRPHVGFMLGGEWVLKNGKVKRLK
jgi:hypothetical protein